MGVFVMLLFFGATAWAVPEIINFQGKLTDSGGVPLEGVYDMRFYICDSETGGSCHWTEDQSVTVIEGIYNLQLGAISDFPVDLFDTEPLFLEVNIYNTGTSIWETLSPRQQLTSTSFSMKSGDADTLDGSHAADFTSALIFSNHETDASAHHVKTTSFTDLTDAAIDAQIPDDITVNYAGTAGNADTLDGLNATDLDESVEIDADIASHAAAVSAHHTRYADPEAVAAIKAADGSGSNLDADLLDGMDSTGFAASSHTHAGSLYGKVAIVAQSGGDYTSPLDAMNDLAAWCGTPDATNTCLIRLMPGIFDLGNNGLAMQPYVDIAGSGENSTTITSTHSTVFVANSATVSGADNAEIRFLTVENQGGGTNSLAIFNDSVSPEITHVSARASGGTNSTGVYNSSSSPAMTNVTANASGGKVNRGVYNSTLSSPAMTFVTASASGGTLSYGVSNFSSSPRMVVVSSNGIIITGNQLFVRASGSDADNGTLLLAVSNEISGLGAASATNRYTIRLDAGIYDLGNNGLAMQPYVDIEGSGENTTTITSTHSGGPLEFLATVSGADNAEMRFLTIENRGGGGSDSIAIVNEFAAPDITNVTAVASGGIEANLGVYNSSSSPVMTNVSASASGGVYSYGVYNMLSSPEMTNVTVTASGGTNYNYGVLNYSSSPAMTNVITTASGGSDNNTGVLNNTSSFPAMINVTARANGGTSSYGVRNNAASSPVMVNVSSNGIIITGNQLFVPASGSDTENGILLLAVSNEISGLGAASATNRYTIRLDAGIYDLGNNGLAMQSYVDIEGSGENTTTITSTHSSGSYDATSATVSGADNAEIRALAVENKGGSYYSIAMRNDSASPDITRVTATASGGSHNLGVSNYSSSPAMRNVSATATGGTYCYGVINGNYSSPAMTNVTASASMGTTINRGVFNDDYSSPTINTSSMSGATNSILNDSTSTAKIAASKLGGSVSGTGFTCVGAYDAFFTALDSSCN
ncbi:MAG: hypothetical protein KKC76_18775 [Proteobacteria bacterium]|nr:hypothetical protein [Pseudomonadota bacterium]MCG2750189.1 hypothetical protein [Desulfobulbaceae bacterium]